LGAGDAAPIALSRLAAGYGDAEADCQIRVDERRRRIRTRSRCPSSRNLALEQERCAGKLRLSVAVTEAELGRILIPLAVTAEKLKREMCDGGSILYAFNLTRILSIFFSSYGALGATLDVRRFASSLSAGIAV
jgi:hypothetical protein